MGASPYLTLTRSNNTAGSTYPSAFGLCANGTYGLQLMSGFNGGPYTNNVTIGASLSNNVPYVLVAVFAVSNWSVYAFPQTGSAPPLILGPTAWTNPLSGVTYTSGATLGLGGAPYWGPHVGAHVYFGAVYNLRLSSAEARGTGHESMAGLQAYGGRGRSPRAQPFFIHFRDRRAIQSARRPATSRSRQSPPIPTRSRSHRASPATSFRHPARLSIRRPPVRHSPSRRSQVAPARSPRQAPPVITSRGRHGH